MKRKEYNNGDVINSIVFIKEIDPYICPSRKMRKATFKCICGKQFDALISSILTGNTKSCGCFGINSRKERFTTHGKRNHKVYKIWCGIKTRCNNKNRKDYKYYGERGIKLSDEFNDFIKFYDYVTELPEYLNMIENKLTIDRIDNNGNYERGNLRWATKQQQTANRNLGY
jgi:hypothetical protein